MRGTPFCYCVGGTGFLARGMLKTIAAVTMDCIGGQWTALESHEV